MNLLPSFQHIVNPKLKNIYLSFDDYGELIIKSPKISNKELEKLLIKKSSWIENSKKRMKLKKGKLLNIVDGTKIYFVGEEYTCRLIRHQHKNSKIIVDNYSIDIYYSSYDNSKFISLVNNFYKLKAKELIPPLVEKFSNIMALVPKDVTFRKTKRQWGSCSSNNVLSFNTMVMKLPIDVIEYIIIHELAHIKHKHHKKDFWYLVEEFMPNYKNKINTLKEYST